MFCRHKAARVHAMLSVPRLRDEGAGARGFHDMRKLARSRAHCDQRRNVDKWHEDVGCISGLLSFLRRRE